MPDQFNILPMDGDAFRAWAALKHGQPIALPGDAMIAATAQAHGLTVVSRGTRDVAALGVIVLNPFTPPP